MPNIVKLGLVFLIVGGVAVVTTNVVSKRL